MDENKAINKEEIEIDIKRVIEALFKHIWFIGITTVLATLIAIGYTFWFVTPMYKSSAMFYVNNNDISVGSVSASITSSDIVASKYLVDSYIVILKTRNCLEDVIDYAELDITYNDIAGMVSAEAVNETEIFKVTVTNSDPKEAETIANAIAYVLPKKIASIMDGTSAKVVEYAIMASHRSSPSYTKNAVIGMAIGFILSAGFVALREIFDLTIRNEEDITDVTKYPILAEVPDMTAPSKGGYYYANGKKKRKYGYYKPGSGKEEEKKVELFGENISFAASEAYKLLRTKIQFSFADEADCHVICTTSALAGEGKSLSSLNLACSLAQLDKKVVLIDCDLRRPSIALKIGIKKSPGLSEYLTRHVHYGDVAQPFSAGSSINFDVISAGKIPPNPMELLSSARMEKIVNRLKENYDYIILDLPPVEEVSDALVAAKLADGVLMVIRQDYCNRTAIENAVKQLEFVNAKILGIVFNATYDDGFVGKYYYRGNYYGKKGYGYGYGYRYGYRRPYYENNYEASAEEAKRAAENSGENSELQKFVRKKSSAKSEENGNENSGV